MGSIVDLSRLRCLMKRVGRLLLLGCEVRIGFLVWVVRLHGGGVAEEALGLGVVLFDAGLFWGEVVVADVGILLRAVVDDGCLGCGLMRDVLFLSFLVAMALVRLVSACLYWRQVG